MEGSLSRIVDNIDIGTVLEQQSYERSMPPCNSLVQRGAVVTNRVACMYALRASCGVLCVSYSRERRTMTTEERAANLQTESRELTAAPLANKNELTFTEPL